MRLWDDLPADPAALEAAFREVYADPVVINGERRTLPELVAMASAMRGVFADTRREPLEVVQAPGYVAVAFRLRGRHVGPLPTPLGTVLLPAPGDGDFSGPPFRCGPEPG